jgi:membrane-associated phospholipid phosphatase
MKITKELVKRIFLDIFSSSQLAIIYAIILHTIYYFNIYTFFIYLSIFFKTYILSIIKNRTIKLDIGKRPKNAFNCNMFSCGGLSTTGGMPSGHITFLFMLFVIMYNNLKRLDLLTDNFIYFFIVVILLTFVGRYFSKCHTLLQIVMGSVLGIILGYFIYFVENILSNNEVFKKDRDIFYKRLYNKEKC